MSHFIKLLFFVLLSVSYGARPPYKDLPPPVPPRAELVVPSGQRRVEETFDRIEISDAYDSQVPLFRAGVDLLDSELKSIEAFIAAPGDNHKKVLYLTRYGLDDMRFAEAMIAAKQKGIRVQFITDFNQSGSFDFASGQERTSDFAKVKFDGKMGAVINKLLAAGFRFNDSQWGLYSQPLFNKAAIEMPPIMHLKGAFGIVEGEKGSYRVLMSRHGTNNLTENDRFNRSIVTNDPAMSEALVEHAKALAQNYAQGKQTFEIDEGAAAPRVRVDYANGFREVAFTNGHYNPNDRIVATLQRAIQNPNEYVIDEVVLSHFVITNRKVVQAIRDYMKINPNFRVTGIQDDRFVDLNVGWNLGPLLEGFPVFSDWGASYPVGGSAFENQVDLFVYQAPAVDRDGQPIVETESDGAPTGRRVWHDKSTLIKGRQKKSARGDWEKVTDIFTGSFNLSQNAQNAELQEQWHIEGESSLGEAFEASIKEPIRLQPDRALSYPVAVMRNMVAAITGQRDLEVPVERAVKVLDIFLNPSPSEGMAELRAQALLPTTLTKKIEANVVEERIRRLEAFLTWFHSELPNAKGMLAKMRLRRMVALGNLVAGQLSPKGSRIALESIFWTPEGKEADVEKWVQGAWKALDIKEPLPAPRAPKPDEGPEVGAPGKAHDTGTVKARPPEAAAVAIAPTDPDRASADTLNVYDIDDTLMSLPTKIVLIGTDGSTKDVSRKDFAVIRQQLGKEGEWKDYHFDPQKSFVYFRDSPTGNFFLDDVMQAERFEDPKQWQAVEFERLQRDLSTAEGARNVIYLTARGHPAEEMDEANRYLQSRGYFDHVPDLEHLFGVGQTANPSEEKARRLIRELEKFEQRAESGRPQSMNYFDNDWGNVEAVVSALKEAKRAGRFQNLRLKVHFVGYNHPFKNASTLEITAGGEVKESAYQAYRSATPLKGCARWFAAKAS